MEIRQVQQVHRIQLNQVKVVVGKNIGFWLLVLDFCSSDLTFKIPRPKAKKQDKKTKELSKKCLQKKVCNIN